ncbi:MAG: 50S ribosomal protein L7/L12 [Clostridia bacterium]|nr:50S ribosomal protein L7/L12 [Clostridia bacterium]
MADLNKIVEEIKELSIVEVSELVKLLEEEFGVSAAATVAVAAAPVEEVKEEKTEFNVVMTATDAGQKIPTIKVLREITGLGLSDAKGLIDKVPVTLKENVPTEQAKEIF